jgi:hypothetical protein
VLTSVSGNWVSVSGATVLTIPSIDVIFVSSSGVAAVSTTLTNDATIRFFDYAEYHATSGVVTSSVLTIHHNSTKIYSVNMATSTSADLLFMPDIPLVLISGDTVKLAFSNPDSCDYTTRLLARR